MLEEFPEVSFVVLNTQTIRPEVNQYSVQEQKLKQNRQDTLE